MFPESQTFTYHNAANPPASYCPDSICNSDHYCRTEETEEKSPGVCKPFSQSLFVDLSENPAETPVPIQLDFRLGHNYFIYLLKNMRQMGINHIALALQPNERPVEEVLEEIGREVVPLFLSHAT